MRHVSKRFSPWFVMFLYVVASQTGTRADDTAVRKAIQAQCDRAVKAQTADNLGAFAAVCTPDAMFLAPGQAPENLQVMESHIGPNPDPSSTVTNDRQTIRRLTLNRKGGDTAEVDKVEVTSGTLSGHPASPGSQAGVHHWVATIPMPDTWVKRRGVWKLKRNAILPGSVFREDGKIVPTGTISN